RLGIPQPWFDNAPMSGEVGDAFARTVIRLEELGYQVSDITLPEVGPTPLLQWAIAEQVQEVHREFRARGEKYGPDVLTRIIAAEEVTAAQAEEGRRWQLRMRDAFATAFQQVD